MGVEVLEREMFSEVEAARLLRVPQSTLHWWLDGGVYRGKQYKPVIRVEPTGQRFVTWAEFVESGLLRTYRRTHGVSLSELRVVMDRLRSEYGMPYPLAHHARSWGRDVGCCCGCKRSRSSSPSSVWWRWPAARCCSPRLPRSSTSGSSGTTTSR